MTEHFAHTMSLLDHPSDPMVMLVEIGLTPAFRFTRAELRQATRRLFARHDKLRFALSVEVARFRPVIAPAELADALNERAWSTDRLSVADFRAQSIPFSSAPLVRFKLDPQAGLMIACHHSLMDGFGCYQLILALFAELQPAEERALTAVAPRSTWGQRLAARMVGIADEFRRSAEIGKHPTTLLGPAAPVTSQKHHFASVDLSLADLAELRAASRPATLNDLILSAFHLTLADTVRDAGRLSVLCPIDMRRRDPATPLFVNRMGYVSVSTLPEHRRGDTLAHVHAQTARAKRYGKEDMVERIMGLYERLGIMRRVRKEWLKSGLPSRFVGPDKFFWKNFDTATVTNMGRLWVPEAYAGWVAHAHAWAPVMAPSISLAVVGHGDTVSFNLRHGDSVLSERAGRGLLDGLVARLGARQQKLLAA